MYNTYVLRNGYYYAKGVVVDGMAIMVEVTANVNNAKRFYRHEDVRQFKKSYGLKEYKTEKLSNYDSEIKST